MGISLPVTLRLLSHELRTPVGVIQGYLKMLTDGRVDEDMRPRVIAQIQRAAARVAAIGQQAADLSHWLADGHPQTLQDLPVGRLADDICRRAPPSLRLTSAVEDSCARRSILTPDPAALVEAGTALVEAVARNYSTEAVLTARTAGDGRGVDLWVTAVASDKDGALLQPVAGHERRSVAFDEAGLGLSLLIAAAVVAAHGGRLWQHPGYTSLGMTLPWSHQP